MLVDVSNSSSLYMTHANDIKSNAASQTRIDPPSPPKKNWDHGYTKL